MPSFRARLAFVAVACLLTAPFGVAHAAAPTGPSAVVAVVAEGSAPFADPDCPSAPPSSPAPPHRPTTGVAAGHTGGRSLADTGAGRSQAMLIAALGMLGGGLVLRVTSRRRQGRRGAS